MKSSLKKMFIMLVISAILLVACGRKDPLNRQTAYFGITEGSSTEVYGVKELYRANTEITREQFLEQDEDVVKELKDYIGDSLPKEKVGTLLYEETPQEDGYELIVYYRSIAGNMVAMLTSAFASIFRQTKIKMWKFSSCCLWRRSNELT